MIPPIERILDLHFSYRNLCLIFPPVLIKSQEELEKTDEVVSLLKSKKYLTSDEQDYLNLLLFLAENSSIE